MSILINGMEMPTSCEECQTVLGCCDELEDGTVWCRLAHGYIGDERTVCPLIPVPAHGRLIDADAVTDAAMEDILGWEDAGCDRSDYRAFLDNYIEDAPTIIPAEEGE